MRVCSLSILCVLALAPPAIAQEAPAPADAPPAAPEAPEAGTPPAPADAPAPPPPAAEAPEAPEAPAAEPPPGKPKGPPTVDDRTEALAKRSARKGRKAMDKGNYAQAVTHFTKAHELWPLPHLLAAVALAQASDGAVNPAWTTVKQAQADAYDDKTRQATAQAAEDLRGMFAETHGMLKATSTPAKATLVLTAGEDKIETETPFERWVEAGRWTLVVSAEGHKPQEGQVTLGRGGEVHHKATLTSLKSIADDKAKIQAEKKAKADAKSAALAAAEARKLKKDQARLDAIEAGRQAVVSAKRQSALFVLGGGAAVIASGVVIALWAGSAEDDLNGLKGSPHRRGEIDAAYDKANATTRASSALLTVGVGILAGGGWLMYSAGDGVGVSGTF